MKISNALTLPAESIFSVNHLSYVMSTESNIRNYLIEALEIDASFIDKFSVHDWVSALEHTLFFRPSDVPTEIYLKSQRLWIMHKLLMRINTVRDKIQYLLALPEIPYGPHASTTAAISSNTKTNAPTPEDQVEIQNVRVGLGQLLLHFQTRLTCGTGGSGQAFSVCEDLVKAVRDFQNAHQSVLQVEKKVYVERRCEIIRWCAWCLCTYGRDWLERCDVNILQNGFHEWMTNRPMLLSFHSTSNSSSSPSSQSTYTTNTPSKISREDSPIPIRKTMTVKI